jgi:hypothetical protein
MSSLSRKGGALITGTLSGIGAEELLDDHDGIAPKVRKAKARASL